MILNASVCTRSRGFRSQIALQSIIRGRSALKVTTATLLVVLTISGLGCSSVLREPDEAAAIIQTEFEALSVKTKQLVVTLEYPETTAEDFARLVGTWKDRRGTPLLMIWDRKLRVARQDHEQGGISKAKLARIEKNIARKLCQRIRAEIDSNEEWFELDDVVKYKQAQCLGYSQLFYILGSSIDLSVIPINVVELQESGPLPTGTAHVSCMVGLSDGRTMMFDLAPAGFVSEPFVMEQTYTKTGNYWELGDQDSSLDIYGTIQLLDKNGLVAYIYSNRGYMHASAGQFDEATSDYNRAIKLNPESAEAYNNRGISHRNLGQLNQAIADYTEAVRLNPEFDEAYNNRGVANAKLGRIREAICDYTKAIALNPKFAEAYNNRANTYVRLKRYDDAIGDYTRAIRCDSSLAKAYGNRAVTYALSGKPEGAKKDLLKAVQLSPALKTYAQTTSDRFQLELGLD